MSIAAINDLRDLLRVDGDLLAFWQGRYNKPCKHLVGYKKAQNANDYPSICYVQTAAKIGDPSGQRLAVSVVVGVNEPGITDDGYEGVIFIDHLPKPMCLKTPWQKLKRLRKNNDSHQH